MPSRATTRAGSASQAEGSLALEGRKLFLKSSASPATAPTREARAPVLEDLYGRVVPLRGGRTARGRRRLHPRIDPRAAKRRSSRAGSRSCPRSRARSTEEDLIQLIAYIKSLRPGETPTRTEACPPPVGARRASRRSRRGDDRTMSTTHRSASYTPQADAAARRRRPRSPSYLNDAYGVRSWLFTTDHKRIAHPVPGLGHALLLRRRGRGHADPPQPDHARRRADHGRRPTTSCSPPTASSWSSSSWSRSIPAVLGNFFLPMMIGAKDLAFPRLNLLSWYIYMIGAAFTLSAIFTGGVDTGWTFYPPYSTRSSHYERDPGRDRRLHRRLLVDHDRAELHRHDPHACGAPA